MDAFATDPDEATIVNRLAEQLIAEGRCDARAIERARRLSVQTGQRLDSVLIQTGSLNETELARAQARLLGLQVVAAEQYPAVAPIMPEQFAATYLRAARALPFAADGGVLRVALADPLDRFTPAAMAAASGLRVVPYAAVPLELEAALTRLYPDDAAGQVATGRDDDDIAADDAERLKDMASEAPVIRLVNQIVQRAVETHASDIHIEPCGDRLRIRFRYDGQLHEVESHPTRLTPAVISRVKIMARLDIAERRLPQDGRIKLAVRGQEVDFRVSTVPSLHGENVVMRVLDRGAVTFDYARLGLPADVISRFRAALELPDGLVLVTGAIGSGKTTTLYTGLLALNTDARKIVTIENPIEYQLPGIIQIQVNPYINLTFASVLRELVRQDPNVIMVGEIRDPETAQVALQAALVGRLVLSTLHTNSAAASITRLRDMGVEDYLLAAVLRGVLAQRLVRRLCDHCRVSAEVPDDIVQQYGVDRVATARPIRFWHPVGCEKCHGTGYRGRIAIAEFLQPNAVIEKMILNRADLEDIERAAIEAGMTPMFDAGIQAALAGTTSFEEILRSVRRRV